MQRSLGWILALGILASVATILMLNVDWAGTRAGSSTSAVASEPSAPSGNEPAVSPQRPSGMFREYFIGDEVERKGEFLAIAAVYFPAVPMEGMTVPTGDDVIHLEADVRATENNPNGFALGQFIPYLKVRYEIVPLSGNDKEPLRGELVPMVARDGLHYGATVVMPGNGSYRLTYHVEPPSAGGLGRHDDPETGVARWWAPFDVTWEWEYTTLPPFPNTTAASR